MQIIEEKDKARIAELVKLHKKAFPGFFLTQLGSLFLETLYKGYLDDKNSGIIVAESQDIIVGFIAYSYDYPNFYKGLLKHKIIVFAWCSFLAFLRHPSYAKRLFGAFHKSEAVEKNEKYVELASICVDPSMKGHGIGSALIDYLKSRVDFQFYAYIMLETDADNNQNVNDFYVKNGFKISKTYVTPEGRKMNEYRFTVLEQHDDN